MVPSANCSIPENTIDDYTGPLNWSEAHCAGEKVKRKWGNHLDKSSVPQETIQQGVAHYGNQDRQKKLSRESFQKGPRAVSEGFERSF